MWFRIRIGPLAALVVTVGLLDSVRGLAGPVSLALSFFPLFLFGVSLLHTILSYSSFGYHQDFSTDHPAKGDPVRYALHVHNHLGFPLSRLSCRFIATGPGTQAVVDYAPFLKARGASEREETILCSYRGVYALGVSSFTFKDALGVLELIHHAEPHVFYVYPELVRLGSGVEALASGGGDGRSIPGGMEEDPGVFETIVPLTHGRGGAKIAWKRYAATGIPAVLAPGGVSAYGLRVVLDLRPCPAFVSEEDRLTAEDLAVTTVFSVLKRLVDHSVPAELVLGEQESGTLIEDEDAFDMMYRLSTNILFTEKSFPSAAFRGGRSTLLISLRSLAGSEPDLYEALEAALAKGYSTRVLIAPAPSRAEEESTQIEAAQARLAGDNTDWVCGILDGRRGTEGVACVFSR